MKHEKEQWYNNLKAKFTFIELNDNNRYIYTLYDISPRLLTFWSEKFEADGLTELWRECGNDREKNDFLKEVIFSDRIELVNKAKRQGLFSNYNSHIEKFALEHYAAICGNSLIYLAVPKLDLVFAPFGIIDLAVMHENTEFIRTVLDHLLEAKKTYKPRLIEHYVHGTRTYNHPHDAHPHFLNSPLSPLMYAANPTILHLLHNKKYGFYLKSTEINTFFEQMAENKIQHNYPQWTQDGFRFFRFYQPPLENFKYLYIKYQPFADNYFSVEDNTLNIAVFHQAAAGKNKKIVRFENSPLLCVEGPISEKLLEQLNPVLKDGISYRTISNEPLINWLIQEQGIEPEIIHQGQKIIDRIQSDIATDFKLDERESKLLIDNTWKESISIRNEYYRLFLSNHLLIPMINWLNIPLSNFLHQAIIGLVAEYAIPTGQYGDVSGDLLSINNESKLRNRLLEIAEKDQQKRIQNVLSIWKNLPLDLINPSLMSATISLPNVPKLQDMAKELKYLSSALPDFKDLNSAKDYIKKILTDDKDCHENSLWDSLYRSVVSIWQKPGGSTKQQSIEGSYLPELEKISTWESLYHWVVDQERKLVKINNNNFSEVSKYILDLKIANLARICNQLIARNVSGKMAIP